MSGACNCSVFLPGPSIAPPCGSASLTFMSLLQVFLRSQCDIEDPCRRVESIDSPFSDYDFIVVGGGSAGSVVASRLSEVPQWKVLLIEAGVNEPTGSQVPGLWVNFFGSSIDWKYKTEPEKMACLGSVEQRCSWPRGKVIGGTSVINGMMYMRGSRKDYNDWEQAGNPGWGYKDVLSYFMKSENNLQMGSVDEGYHGTGGLLPVSQFPYHPPIAEAFLEGAKELGQRVGDLNGKTHEGFAIAQATNKNGIRFSSAHAFLRPAKTRTNLHILLNTTVTRVLVDPKTKKALGVEIMKPCGKTEQVLAKKEVIVSGGAVNSPQILLLSGIGPKEDLEKVGIPVVHDLPGVGKNLHNHVGHTIKFYIDNNQVVDLDWATAMQYMLHRDGLLSSTGLSSLTGMVKSKFANSSEDHPDIQIFFGGYKANCAKTGEVGQVLENEDGSPKKRMITMTPTNLHPKSRGYLTLKDKNPLSHPKIVPKYLTEIEDVHRLIEGIRFGIKLAETKALEEYGIKLDTIPITACKHLTFGSDEYWECAVRHNTAPENHQAGSCKMGPSSDPLAVVDHQLKVRGIDNLRVMDASIMPKLTSGNTNAVCIMIGEKGADMIRKSWSRQ
ncbi:glucose dehydrogenase [FAD, quinone]-like [Macrosteles quadrilineatus]|uniref:glucose dehydrogenase [FAD, quinone]-like n=1 Tax=Macrosteles quadrilineatus TaxID=74068 RepID=UPI0023E1318A|nr:glucose dehydrogenase [FAD, quinone]-like [Macrosteles quadrilineatus]XP_054280676.1 glucose dehydrogenase [FAD, quinone]-like [Macrosteles quadrilineatus]